MADQLKINEKQEGLKSYRPREKSNHKSSFTGVKG